MGNKYERFRFATSPTESSARPETRAARDQSVDELHRLSDELRLDPLRPDGELHRLRDELTALKATLADRETALAKATLEAEQARERWQQETQAALLKAEQAWMAREASRLVEAEAKWRRQSGRALADATARCQAAEAVLAQLKDEAARARSDTARSSLLERRADEESGFTQGSRIILRPDRMTAGAETVDQKPSAPRTRLIRDVLIVASLATLAIIAYPSIEPLLPPAWQSNIAAVTSGFGPIANGPGASIASPIPAVSPNVAAQGLAVVVRDVNVRLGPSTDAKVISALPRGVKVTTIERRGNWTSVRIEADNRNAKPLQGWVYGSFLKDEVATTGQR